MKYSFYITIFVFFVIACQSNNETTQEKEITSVSDTISNDSITTTPISSIQEDEKEGIELEEDLEDEMPSRSFEWTGTINGSIGIHGHYTMANGFMDSGMDMWVGELIYDKVGKPIQLIGQIQKDGESIRLLEINQKGNVTGILYGKWKNGSITEGTWYSPTKRNSLSLTINATIKEAVDYSEARPSKIADILGQYHYEYGSEGPLGTLDVHSVKDNQVSFDLACLTSAPGRNIASLEEATEPMLNYAIDINRYEGCHFNIRFFKDFAVINYVEEKDNCEFGHNASVSGIFRKIK
jgi:hypothetical protein